MALFVLDLAPFSVGRLTNRPRSNMSPDSCGLAQERLACGMKAGQGREDRGSLCFAPKREKGIKDFHTCGQRKLLSISG